MLPNFTKLQHRRFGPATGRVFLAWCVAREALSQAYKKMIPRFMELSGPPPGVWVCSTAYLVRGPSSDVEFFYTFGRNMHTAAASEMKEAD